MKKIILISSLMFLAMATVATAQNKQGQSAAVKQTTVDSAQGNQVQNQNMVETKNMGEEQQLMVNTQESESLQASKSSETKKKVATVSEALAEITEVKGKDDAGKKVGELIQQQKQAQADIESELNKLESRKGLVKTLVGPNYKAIKNLNQVKEQNRLRIENLKELQVQLFNYADQVQIQEAIQVLEEQNTALAEQIQLEEETKSLFGWLVKIVIGK